MCTEFYQTPSLYPLIKSRGPNIFVEWTVCFHLQNNPMSQVLVFSSVQWADKTQGGFAFARMTCPETSAQNRKPICGPWSRWSFCKPSMRARESQQNPGRAPGMCRADRGEVKGARDAPGGRLLGNKGHFWFCISSTWRGGFQNWLLGSHLRNPEVRSAVSNVHTEAPRRGPQLRGFNGGSSDKMQDAQLTWKFV